MGFSSNYGLCTFDREIFQGLKINVVTILIKLQHFFKNLLRHNQNNNLKIAYERNCRKNIFFHNQSSNTQIKYILCTRNAILGENFLVKYFLRNFKVQFSLSLFTVYKKSFNEILAIFLLVLFKKAD